MPINCTFLSHKRGVILSPVMMCPTCEQEALRTLKTAKGTVHDCARCGFFFAGYELLAAYSEDAERCRRAFAETADFRLPTARDCPQCKAKLQQGRSSTANLILTHCPACQAVWIDFRTLAVFDRALERALHAQVQIVIEQLAPPPSEDAPPPPEPSSLAKALKSLARSLEKTADRMGANIPDKKPADVQKPAPKPVQKPIEKPKKFDVQPAPPPPLPKKEEPAVPVKKPEPAKPVEPVMPKEPARPAAPPPEPVPAPVPVEPPPPVVLPPIPEPVSLPAPDEPPKKVEPVKDIEPVKPVEPVKPTVPQIPAAPSPRQVAGRGPTKTLGPSKPKISIWQELKAAFGPRPSTPKPKPAPKPYVPPVKGPLEEVKPVVPVKEVEPAKPIEAPPPALPPVLAPAAAKPSLGARFVDWLPKLLPGVTLIFQWLTAYEFELLYAAAWTLAAWSLARMAVLASVYRSKKRVELMGSLESRKEKGSLRWYLVREGDSILLDAQPAWQIAPAIFGISGFQRLAKEPVTVKGWWRGSRSPWLELSELRSPKGNRQSLVKAVRWSFAVIVFVMTLAILYTGY